jgi:adenine deaminase
MIIQGQLVDIHTRSVFPARIEVVKGRIKSIVRLSNAPEQFIMPGLIDAHIHIESSMLTPGAFAMEAVKKGTIGVVSDPHEIANVLGIEGVRFMMTDGKKVPFRFWFGAPSCVPATDFETSGARLEGDDLEELLKDPEIFYLSEMMNYPGVIYSEDQVISKIELAKKYKKPIDGHAPGISGKELKKYVTAGISTDHECSTLSEALEKSSLGMKILIREGSAARNLDALQDMIKIRPEMLMLCSDDIHPEMLIKRHINKIVALLINRGFDVFDVIRSASLNPVLHYNLDCGLLRVGDRADFIVSDSLKEMNILETWIDGKRVFKRGRILFNYKGAHPVNRFNCTLIGMDDLLVKNQGRKIRVIGVTDGELTTKELITGIADSKYVSSDPQKDILKIVVKDRYNDGPPAMGFITGFGLKNGAFAGSIAHDSHNIIAVGVDDFDIVAAINEVIRCEGGLAVSDGDNIDSMELKIGGIMSDRNCGDVAGGYQYLSDKVKILGCNLCASFMALLVIPELKIGDKGLFNVLDFKKTSLFV